MDFEEVMPFTGDELARRPDDMREPTAELSNQPVAG